MQGVAQQSIIMNESKAITVLVTGFGEFLNIKTNPSWEIVSRLPSGIEDPLMGYSVRIITQLVPLKAAYHSLLSTVPALLEQHVPDFVIHMGLAADRDYFAIEKGAKRDGYHEIPDEDRKVVTRAEAKKLWSKSPSRLESVMDIEEVLDSWKVSAQLGVPKGKGKMKSKAIGKEWDLRTSDDVGNYVCGFVYYVTLEWLWKKKKPAQVLFFHVPNLTGLYEFERGRDITVALIKAVVSTSCS